MEEMEKAFLGSGSTGDFEEERKTACPLRLGRRSPNSRGWEWFEGFLGSQLFSWWRKVLGQQDLGRLFVCVCVFMR